MGWREKVGEWARDAVADDDDSVGIVIDAMGRVLLGMLDADRIALARELLPEGWMVARDVGEMTWHNACRFHYHAATWQSGYNRCRDEMQGNVEPLEPVAIEPVRVGESAYAYLKRAGYSRAYGVSEDSRAAMLADPDA